VFAVDSRAVVHPRQPFGGRSVDYRRYLCELARKPQALRQVADELIGALDEPLAAAADARRPARSEASRAIVRAGAARDRSAWRPRLPTVRSSFHASIPGTTRST
jgi:hypothetical protein